MKKNYNKCKKKRKKRERKSGQNKNEKIYIIIARGPCMYNNKSFLKY
jgi:hypothetical protein